VTAIKIQVSAVGFLDSSLTLFALAALLMVFVGSSFLNNRLNDYSE
jgi:hypothetical protein